LNSGTIRFFSAANCNPFLDPDGDRTDKLSVFGISGIEPSAGASNVVIRWPTLPGRLYAVCWSMNGTESFLPLDRILPHTQTNSSNTTSPQSGFNRVTVKME